MDDGVDVQYGGLGLRQLGVAVARCKLKLLVANFMKVLCSQEIYRSTMMELDWPDIPIGMLSSVHLNRCEELLLEFIERIKSMPESGHRGNLMWLDLSNKWFTLMHSTRPFTIRDYQELADHVAAAFETVRDITLASHLIGDMRGDMSDSTLDDPLSDRYMKLGCSVAPLEKESDDSKSYGVSIENIFAVDSSACPSYDDLKKLPNKVLLWCGTRSSNLLGHLHKGFLPAVCSIPVPGYMFGRLLSAQMQQLRLRGMDSQQ